MPFALLIAGAILLVSGVRNTQADLFKLLKGDFTGQHNFIFWFTSILIIGAIGYIPKLKPVSNAFLVLIVVVLFLANKGFFAKLNQQIGSTQTDSASLTSGTLGLPSSGLQIPQIPILF